MAICTLLFFSLTASAENAMRFNDWRQLEKGIELCNDHTVKYFEFQTLNASKASLIVAKAKSNKFRLKPCLNNPTCPTSTAAEVNSAMAAVNGGFFNLSNGESTSYVVIDGKLVCDPKKNLALINNPKLKPYLNVIFNRSEIRFLHDRKGCTLIQLARHYDELPKGTTLVDSLQAGPMLLPKITDKEEAFVRTDSDGKEVDSIGSRKTAARTAFGVTVDGYIMMLCVSDKGQDEFSSGITLQELSNLMKQLGCTQAINLDGGTSATMVISNGHSKLGSHKPSYKVVCGRTPETRVKSVLLLQQK